MCVFTAPLISANNWSDENHAGAGGSDQTGEEGTNKKENDVGAWSSNQISA